MTTNFSSATVDLAEPVFSEQERPALAGFPVGDSGLAGEAAPGVLPRQRGRLADLGVPVLPVAGAGAIAFAIFCMIDAAVFHTQNGVSNVVWMVILPWVVVIGSVIYYPDARTLVLMITNKGKYTITRVEAQFSPDGKSLLPHDTSIRIADLDNLPDKLRAGQPDRTEAAHGSVLTPWDAGMRFECQRVHKKDISGPYAVVRWTDRWGQRWEHKKGEVRKIAGGEQWNP